MKRALLVGINNYPHAELHGCVEDVLRLRRILERHDDGKLNFACKCLIAPDERVTRAVLRKNLDELFARDADVALFYFSGHGIANRIGGYLVTQDAKEYDEGIPLRDILSLANQGCTREAVIILDCCAGGSFQGSEPHGEHVQIREGISMMTATRGMERAAETDAGGLFTTMVCDALEGGAADVDGNVTVASVYAYVDRAMGAWDQRPLLLSHVSRLIPLRTCNRAIEPVILQLLPEYFSSPDTELPLDPSYEPDESPRNEKNERVFGHLQRLRAVRLLEPIGEEHMYYAALNSKSCRLTPLGRYYWNLAKSGRL